ncbi:MAG: ABC transporter ATP-binding protein [Euryarchaeota archaeon]|nr:ABC transporter ATP-binding protein [Euryarchaeota archaeon]
MSHLEISNLRVRFPTDDGVVRVTNGVDLDIDEGENLGLIGESGSGKTVLGMAIVRLLPGDAKIEGAIRFNGRDLLTLNEAEMRRIRGREIVMILQNPTNSLNPVLTIGSQIEEAVRLHSELDKERAKKKVVELLEEVGIRSAARRAKEYPHQFSGGMKERAMIAMALASDPSLIIADEPTKGLDVTIKRRVVTLIKEVTKTKSMLFITHDLGSAAEICDRIAVMYAGEILEIAGTEDLLNDPLHPYTMGFLDSLPSRGLKPIPGMGPSLIDLPSGCKFHPRCDRAMELCKREDPPMIQKENRRQVRCFQYA